MFARSILFVGADGVGSGVLAEALAQDAARGRQQLATMRFFSATISKVSEIDSVLLRAMQKLNLDTAGLSMKPLALYGFAGAPRIDHVILLNAELPSAVRFSLGAKADVQTWDLGLSNIAKRTPGERFQAFLHLAERLRTPVNRLVDDLSALDAQQTQALANTA